MLGRGRLELSQQIPADGVVSREQWGKNGEQHQHRDDGEADACARVAPEPGPHFGDHRAARIA